MMLRSTSFLASLVCMMVWAWVRRAQVIKTFCEVTDVMIPWKKITRGLPRVKRYADDRAPTIEEIGKIIEYPDRRIKPIIYTMATSGIRLGA
jgi:hypothetical protein